MVEVCEGMRGVFEEMCVYLENTLRGTIVDRMGLIILAEGFVTHVLIH